jgi:predicted RNA-binding protein with RPS1 domain
LSRKALLPSPWDEIKKKYDGNELIEGEVTNVVDFGAFVALPEGVEGLLHVSEMVVSGSGSPEETLRPGDKVLVRIVEFNPEEERIGLSMQQVTYDEQMTWMEQQRETEPSLGEEQDVDEDEPAQSVTAGEEGEVEGEATLASDLEEGPASLEDEKADAAAAELDSEDVQEAPQDSVLEEKARSDVEGKMTQASSVKADESAGGVDSAQDNLTEEEPEEEVEQE